MSGIARIMVLALALSAMPGQARPGGPAFTVEPSMAKGPASAPVTIVEFSDYQ